MHADRLLELVPPPASWPRAVPPEGPAQHVRNALQVLGTIPANPDSTVTLRPEDVASIRQRLTVAILQLEGRA